MRHTHRYQKIRISPETATYKQGRLGHPLVVSPTNSGGVPNFLTTGGHTTGTSLLRWVNSKSNPLPTCKVVKVASLKR